MIFASLVTQNPQRDGEPAPIVHAVPVRPSLWQRLKQRFGWRASRG